MPGDEIEVVFLHPLPFDGGFWDDIRAEFEDFASWAPTMYSPGLRQRGVGAAWEEIWAPLFAAGTSPEIIQQAKSAALALSVDSIAAGIEMFHSRRDLDQWLEGWSGPLTVVSGSKDTAPLSAVGKAMAGRVRHGRFRIVEGSGHYVPIEQPEAMTSILAEVLRGEG